jgi:hypothetical protein
MRFSISVVYKKLSWNSEFYVSRSESRTLLNEVIEFQHVISIFFVTDLGEIRYRISPRNAAGRI